MPLLLPPASDQQLIVLRLNAEVDASGNLTVQLQDADTGQPLGGFSHGDCMPLRGNGVRQSVAWGGDRGTWLGGNPALPNASTPIVLNFSMVHAKVYAWEMALV